LAAYNAGEDKVQRAIDRTSSGDFIAIAQRGRLPLETLAYVPAVLKAMEAMADKQTVLKIAFKAD
jgi:hypothetical protein